MTHAVQELAKMIQASKKVVFFGGAGVSTESGIPDFRSAQGIYLKKHLIPPEQILSHSFFLANPEAFYDFYREHLLIPNAKPNLAHQALKKLEELEKLTCIITQNIDGLHQAAGSKLVFELHGSTRRNYCMACKKPYGMETILERVPLPYCECGGLIRPDVVLYEEGLNDEVIRQSVQYVKKSDLLIVGGTSLVVYPAASLAGLCPGKLVIINRDPTPYDRAADLVIRDSIGEVLHGTVKALVNFFDSEP